MVSPQTITELNRAFQQTPGGFVVVDSGKPRFAVLDYGAYEKLKLQKQQRGPAGKILVTGGAGYIGSVTVRLLQQQGYEVIVFDNLSTGRKEAVRDCQLVVADLADRAALDKLFSEERIDSVIHFAASVEVEESVQNPQKYYENNVIAGLKLLDAMVEHDVSKLVFSSTAAVYGHPEKSVVTESAPCQPQSPYGVSKLMFEQMLRSYEQAYGIHSVTLRYFNAAGAWPEEGLGYQQGVYAHLIPRVLDVASGHKPELLVYGQDYPTRDGTGIRDYIHVLDLAEAHIAALQKLERDNGVYVYNVGTGKGHTVLEVIEGAVEVTGRMIPCRIAARRPGDPAQYVADSQLLQSEFGWQPHYDLSAILESSWEWHKRL